MLWAWYVYVAGAGGSWVMGPYPDEAHAKQFVKESITQDLGCWVSFPGKVGQTFIPIHGIDLFQVYQQLP